MQIKALHEYAITLVSVERERERERESTKIRSPDIIYEYE